MERTVVSLSDLTALAFEARRAGYSRAQLHEDDGIRASVLRVQPGSGVPAHYHSASHDLFMVIEGELEIRWDGGHSLLKPGVLCKVPPGVRHEVRNPSEQEEAFCLLLHTRPAQFDFVETEAGGPPCLRSTQSGMDVTCLEENRREIY